MGALDAREAGEKACSRCKNQNPPEKAYINYAKSDEENIIIIRNIIADNTTLLLPRLEPSSLSSHCNFPTSIIYESPRFLAA
jgi:hypothetical protein